MKQNYIAPEMEIVEMELEAIISMSINMQEQGDENEDFARGRRGTWGNLWG